MKKQLIIWGISLLFSFITVHTYAQIRLPRLISDSMVLQRETKIKIWGWASSGEQVTIKFIGKTYNTIASQEGKWMIQLPCLKAGGPFDMEIAGTNHITLKNVLIGDVWLLTGQSNMTITMERVKYKYPEEVANCNYSQIRQFNVPERYNHFAAQDDVSNGSWKAANPDNIMSFSAIGYFFAKKIQEKYHVPIGLIKTCVGGTPVEAWISEEPLKQFPETWKAVEKMRDTASLTPKLRASRAANYTWYKTVRENDKGFIANEKTWYDETLDDSAWPTIEIPSFWADQGLGMINGVVWFRKSIDVPASMTGKPSKLWLGRIVDADSVYVNGQFVGTISYQYPPRIYDIPAGLLREGKNSIVVRVISNFGKGGFIKDKPYKLQAGEESIDLKGEWKYNVGAKMQPLRGSISPLYQPLGLYNGMISPVINYGIKGALWYQGEANTGKPATYEKLLSTLISDWRQKWGQGNFPFLFVQLPNFMEVNEQPTESNWAELREQQLKTLSVPNTGMAVTIELGEWNDIHPLNKKDVAERLALAAQKVAYGEKKVIYSGPIYQSAEIKGNKIILSFSNMGSGLLAKGGDLKQFAIAGPDKKFIWANAKIQENKVVVWSDQISNPVSVRYAWANNPEGANLYNKEGLPASPFKTND